jgi:hypothetical protein
MSWKQALVALTVLVPVTSQADAAAVTFSQDVYAQGDFATGVYDDNYMPTFDSSLGTLNSVRIHLAGMLDWGQPFVAETETPNTVGTVQTLGSVLVFGNDGISREIDAPTQTHKFRSEIDGFSGTMSIHGTFSDDASLYLDPFNPEDLLIEPFAAVICGSNCINEFSDDASGLFSGTLQATFVYTPVSSVPEPSSFLLFLSGAALLGGALQPYRKYLR